MVRSQAERRFLQVKPKPNPGKKFEDALRKVLSVPKKDVDKAVVREKKARDARRTEQPKIATRTATH